MKLNKQPSNTGLNDYVTAVKRECVRIDLIKAFTDQPEALLAAVTDHPQATLDAYSKPYGIQLHAADELPLITCLVLKSRQGHDLNTLLAEQANSSKILLSQAKESVKQAHTAMRQHSLLARPSTAKSVEVVELTAESNQFKKK